MTSDDDGFGFTDDESPSLNIQLQLNKKPFYPPVGRFYPQPSQWQQQQRQSIIQHPTNHYSNVLSQRRFVPQESLLVPRTNSGQTAMVPWNTGMQAHIPNNRHYQMTIGARSFPPAFIANTSEDYSDVDPALLNVGTVGTSKVPQTRTGASASEESEPSTVTKSRLTACAVVSIIGFLILLIILLLVWNQTKENQDAINHIQVVTVYSSKFNSHCPVCVCNMTCDIPFSSSSTGGV